MLCGLGSFRSTMLTPCLQGGETLYLQIDGYYGEVGDVEVSIQAAPLNSWEVNVSVDDLSCSLQQSFNPDGTIVANTNVDLRQSIGLGVVRLDLSPTIRRWVRCCQDRTSWKRLFVAKPLRGNTWLRNLLHWNSRCFGAGLCGWCHGG